MKATGFVVGLCRIGRPRALSFAKARLRGAHRDCFENWFA
jgi:hypothetical protein